MRFNQLALFGLTAMAGLGLAPSAFAGTTDPGSLLVYHEFDNRSGVMTLYTITNVNTDDSVSSGNGIQAGTVDVEFVYRGKLANVVYGGGSESSYEYDPTIDCLEFNRTHRLTPNDTLTVLTRFDNPQEVAGYMYAFAKRINTNVAIAFDHLIGNALIIDGLSVFNYSVNAVVYRAGEGLVQGDETDLDADGIRDLNGAEYEQSPDQLLIPRFFGEGRHIASDLVLINLTGGPEFTARVAFLVYNDNEEVFSAEFPFNCWIKKPLRQISGVFNNDFLLHSTNQNPNEILGVQGQETGWIRLDGKIATSQSAAILDPAILALLVEKVGSYKAAEFPFTLGLQDNGDLLPDGPFGDVDGPSGD